MKRYLSVALLSLSLAAPAVASRAVVLGGTGPDPGGVWQDLSGLVDKVAVEFHIPETLRDDFKSRIVLSYAQSEGNQSGIRTAHIAGKVSLPTCNSERSYAFSLDTSARADHEAGVQIADVLTEQIEISMVEFANHCALP